MLVTLALGFIGACFSTHLLYGVVAKYVVLSPSIGLLCASLVSILIALIVLSTWRKKRLEQCILSKDAQFYQPVKTNGHKTLLLFLGIVCGVLWTTWHIHSALSHTLPDAYAKSIFTVQGRIERIKPVQYGRERGYKLTIAVHDAVAEESMDQIPQFPTMRRVLVYAKHHHLLALGETGRYRIGDIGTWRMRLKPPHGFASPGSFSYEKWLLSQDISATGSVKSLLSLTPHAKPTLASLWAAWLQTHLALPHDGVPNLSSRENHSSKDAHSATPLLYALLTGDKSYIPRAYSQTLQRSGTSHLFAISGMHLAMIALSLSVLLKALSFIITPLASLTTQVVLILTTLCLFAAVTGWQPPITRALLMLTLLYAIWVSNRYLSLPRIYLLAMAFVLLFNPVVVLHLGFWLSFGALFFIIIINTHRTQQTQWIQDSLAEQASNIANLHTIENNQCLPSTYKKRFIDMRIQCTDYCRQSLRRYAYYLLQFLRFQLWLLLLLWPITALFFNQITLAALVSNLIAIPAMTILIMPLLLIGIGLAPLFTYVGADIDGGNPLLAGAGSCLTRLFDILTIIQSHLQPVLLHVSAIDACLLSACIIICYWLRSVWLWLAIVLLILLMVTAPRQPLSDGEYSVTALDVGQGLSLVIRTRTQVMVFDTGNRWSDYADAMTFIGIPYLLHERLRSINHVVLSHGDNDHMGAFAPLADYASIDTVWLGSGVDANDLGQHASAVTIRSCQTATSWRVDGVTMKWLAQARALPKAQENSPSTAIDENHHSCVLAIQSPYGRTLIPSDIDRARERLLLDNMAALSPVDLLIAPHHGSKTSSSRQWLEQIKPRHVVYSAGYANRYNHPHPDVVARYDALGSQRHDTAYDGTILFEMKKDAMLIHAHRKSMPFWWQITKYGSPSQTK